MLAETQALAMDRTALPANDPYAVLGFVQRMHQARSPRSGPFITIFEVGGGDPAMNGSFIYLRIEHNERSLVWRTGLNVRSVNKVTFGSGNAVVLSVEEDFMDSKSAIVRRTATYRAVFHMDDGELLDTVTLEKDTAGAGGKQAP